MILMVLLSDIHIKDKGVTFLDKHESIANIVVSSSAGVEAIYIIVSGDIAFSGVAEQYNIASVFFDSLHENIRTNYCGSIEFVFIPGNHDCNFKVSKSVRDILLRSIEGNKSDAVDDDVLNVMTSVQEEYDAFSRKYINGLIHDTPIWKVKESHVCGNKIVFNMINLSWCSSLSETQGNLYFPSSRIFDVTPLNSDLVISVFHHPFNWLEQSSYQKFKPNVRAMSDFIITGHEHNGLAVDTNDNISGSCVLLESDSFFDENKNSAFGILLIDFNNKDYTHTRYKYDDKSNIYIEMDIRGGRYKDEGDIVRSRYALNNNFSEKINDSGANFENSGVEQIYLNDVYIFPHLKRKYVEDDDRLIDGSILLDISKISGGIILEGDEKSGKSSLVNKVYSEYFLKGFIPLYIDGKKIKSPTKIELDKLVKKSLKEQYSTENIYDKYLQENKSKKLIFIDNLDESKVKSISYRDQIINYFESFSYSIVLTVGEMFDIREILLEKSTSNLKSYSHYKIQQFGYAKRNELIRKWYSIGAYRYLNKDELISKVDKAEKNMSMVITKSLVPSTPIYLLTLMQSMESGAKGELSDSSLGEYYRYLITRSIISSGINKEKISEVYEYLKHLSWSMHLFNQDFTFEHFKAFNSDFSTRRHSVDFKERLNILIDAKIIENQGDVYSFRYPYIYYFFKGLYLSDNVDNTDCIEHIRHCFNHLYVRTNANTILFLAHHATGNSYRYLIDCMSNAVGGMFCNKRVVTFEDDEGINNFIKDSPKIAYKDSCPLENRKRQSEVKDEFDGGDGFLEKEESFDNDLSIVAKVTSLYKAIDIVGQFLKNQYSRLERDEKRILLNDLFSAPMRALSDFYDFIKSNPDAFTNEIERAIVRKGAVEQKERIREISQKIVAGLIQMMSMSFIMKPAMSANADSLKEDVLKLVQEKNIMSYRLIELCMRLDSPNPFPRRTIEDIYNESSNNIPVRKILEILIVNRLYMFKTTEADMQWLSSQLNFDIKIQHNISYARKSSKLIN